MRPTLSLVTALAVATLSASDAAAQASRFELVPQFGYTWGGARSFRGFTENGVTFPNGAIVAEASPSWGVTAAFNTGHGSNFTIMYQRQDTKLRIDWRQTPPVNIDADPGFATNAVLFGFRQDFAQSRAQKLVPYLGFGLGFNIFDVKADQVGSDTYFIMSPHGGVRYMLGNNPRGARLGLQVDLRGLFTFVPDGNVQIWCNWWGFCAASESFTSVSQGTISGGLIIKF
ncbi:MAG: hypothetical protein MUC69_11150 [Gemmatimonadales bacterium]|nr:hypothetical protein [Gemmatimonadales bacterium]